MKTNKLWSILMMFVLVLGMTATFSSCGSDDEDIIGDENSTNNDNSNSSTIVGTWYCEENSEVGGFCYNADGTGYVFFDGKTKQDSFTYEAKDNKINFLSGKSYAGMSMQYTISGNKLIVSMYGMSLTYIRRS